MAKHAFDPASILSDDEKAAIVNQRAKQWAAEAFSHQLNREALLAADPNGRDLLLTFAKCLQDLADRGLKRIYPLLWILFQMAWRKSFDQAISLLGGCENLTRFHIQSDSFGGLRAAIDT